MKRQSILSWVFKIGLILNLGLCLSYIGLWLLAIQQNLTWRADFTAFYTGGMLLYSGQGHNLYNYDLQATCQQNILEGKSFSDGLLAFNYPPYVAFLFVPLVSFSLSTAYALWAALEIVIFGSFLRQIHLFATEEGWGREARTQLLVAVAALPSVIVAMLLGTFTPLIVFCLLQFYRALRRGADIEAGLWLALGSVKPQVMVMPALALLGTRRWRALGTAVGLGLLLFILTVLMLGWDVWGGFLKALEFSGGQFGAYGIVPGDMYNLKGTLTLWLGNRHTAPINLISWICFGLAGMVTLWLWHRQRKTQDVALHDLAAGSATVLGILFGPHVNPQDGFLLALPVVWCYSYLYLRQKSTHRWRFFSLGLPLLLLIGEYGLVTIGGIHMHVLVLVFLCVWMGQAWYSEFHHPQRVS